MWYKWNCKVACSNSAYWVFPSISGLLLMRVQFDLGTNLPWCKSVTLHQDSFSVPRGQILSNKLWCPKQGCSSTVRGGTPSASPSCHFVRACSTGSPCWTPLLCVHMHKKCIYLSESRFSVFPSHWIACLLQRFVFLPVMWTQCELKSFITYFSDFFSFL